MQNCMPYLISTDSSGMKTVQCVEFAGLQAGKPPSGTVYNPDKSGQLSSLGVHEHWNNAVERKYSRNLCRKEGIELIASV